MAGPRNPYMCNTNLLNYYPFLWIMCTYFSHFSHVALTWFFFVTQLPDRHVENSQRTSCSSHSLASTCRNIFTNKRSEQKLATLTFLLFCLLQEMVRISMCIEFRVVGALGAKRNAVRLNFAPPKGTGLDYHQFQKPLNHFLAQTNLN